MAHTVSTADITCQVSTAFFLSGSNVNMVMSNYSTAIEKAICGFLFFLAARLIYRAI